MRQPVIGLDFQSYLPTAIVPYMLLLAFNVFNRYAVLQLNLLMLFHTSMGGGRGWRDRAGEGGWSTLDGEGGELFTCEWVRIYKTRGKGCQTCTASAFSFKMASFSRLFLVAQTLN